MLNAHWLEFITEQVGQAHQQGEVATLAHLYYHCLNQPPWNQTEAVKTALRRIQNEILKHCQTHVQKQGIAVAFLPREAAINLTQYLAQNDLASVNQHQAVFQWLLTGDFIDNTQNSCRRICAEEGVTIQIFSDTRESVTLITELGFGNYVEKTWLPAMVGREQDITKHFGFLTLALRQDKPYLLEGWPGVGKTTFLKGLLQFALQKWETGSDVVLNKRRFIWFEHSDFIGSELEREKRLETVYAYLKNHPEVVPIFDGFEYFMNKSLGIYEQFAATLGGVINGGNRCLILVCQSGAASQAEFLNSFHGISLPALSEQATKQVLLNHLSSRQGEITLTFSPSQEEFCDQLINVAAQRYPGRFFPEVALNLAESVINRGLNRSLYFNQETYGQITIQDIWEQANDEQGHQPFGLDPEHFYDEINKRLKMELIGQDHAIEQICNVLKMQASRPPSRLPRGRFLFVGPPGVGKTELARCFARHLGLGEEAFFVFNMSEYATESARTRFTGADPGYVGFRSTRTLYDLVRTRPSCVVLLDEIDRSDPSIQDILLSILEGQGKDSTGSPVYFSQTIFILTTNQHQEVIQAAYRNMLDSGEYNRVQLAAKYDDDKLRTLILSGCVDDTEANMRAYLYAELQQVRQVFEHQSVNNDQGLEPIQRYLALQELYNGIEHRQRKNPLDRALLDRIDFIIPFFPIKEESLLAQILELKLQKAGWNTCPDTIRQRILEQAIAQDESVRPLERLIIKYRSQTL
jgi:ATP-dependent Clp protease ATP-binding subunit ClpA